MGTVWDVASSTITTEEYAVRLIVAAIFAIAAITVLHAISRRRLHTALICFIFVVSIVAITSLALLSEAISVMVACTGWWV